MEKLDKNVPHKIRVEIKLNEKNKSNRQHLDNRNENEKSAKLIVYKKSQLQELIKQRAQILKTKMDKVCKTKPNTALVISLRKKFEDIANKCKNKTERYLRTPKSASAKMIKSEKNQIKTNEQN